MQENFAPLPCSTFLLLFGAGHTPFKSPTASRCVTQ